MPYATVEYASGYRVISVAEAVTASVTMSAVGTLTVLGGVTVTSVPRQTSWGFIPVTTTYTSG